MCAISCASYQEITNTTSLIIKSVQESLEQSVTMLFSFLGPKVDSFAQQALSSVIKTWEC